MAITLELRPHVTEVASEQDIRNSRLFAEWAQNFTHTNAHVIISEANVWAEEGELPEIHSLQVTVQLEGERWRHYGMLRPPTVDVLTRLWYGDTCYIALVDQYRPMTGNRMLSNPAGGKKWYQSPEQAATNEVWEELHIGHYTRLNLGDYYTLTRMTQEPRAVSPGIINEYTWFFVADFHLPSAEELEALKSFLHGRKTGVAADGENITVHVVYRGDVREYISVYRPPVDLKTEAAFNYAGV